MSDDCLDLSWRSQYPHEKEIVFAPLTGIEVQRTRVEGPVLVVEARLSVNLMAATIEQVVGKRRKVVQDAASQMVSEFHSAISREVAQGYHEATCDVTQTQIVVSTPPTTVLQTRCRRRDGTLPCLTDVV